MLARLFSKKTEEKHVDAGSALTTIEERLLNRVFSMYQQNQLTDPELLRLCAEWYAIQQLSADKIESAHRAPLVTESHPSPSDMAPIEDISHSTASTIMSEMASKNSMIAQEEEPIHHLQIQSVPIGPDQDSDEEQAIPVRTALSDQADLFKVAPTPQMIKVEATETDDQNMHQIPVSGIVSHAVASSLPINQPPEMPQIIAIQSEPRPEEPYTHEEAGMEQDEVRSQDQGVSPAQRLRKILMIDNKSGTKAAHYEKQKAESLPESPFPRFAPSTVMHSSAYTSSSRAMPFDLNEPEVIIPLAALASHSAMTDTPKGMVPFQPSMPLTKKSTAANTPNSNKPDPGRAISPSINTNEEFLPTVSQLSIEVSDKDSEFVAGSTKHKVSYKPKLKFH